MQRIYRNKIERIIEEQLDSRLEYTVLSYIMEKGICNLRNMTESKIKAVKGNAYMSDRLCQAIVRCATTIAKECNTLEIMQYIRKYAVFNPVQKPVSLYKDDYTEDSWALLLSELGIRSHGETVVNLFIIKEDY
jgi:hypothetical protein